LDISDSRIATNQATGGRGGDGGYYYYYTWPSGGTATAYLGGYGGAAQGGGLYVSGGSLTIATSTIASNQGTAGPGGRNGYYGLGEGGGLYILSNTGTPTVTGSTLSGNSAYSGGGIANYGTLTVSDSTLSGNSASGDFYNGSGGGIYNIGFSTTLTVRNSTLSGNSASGYAASGGGIYNNGGTLTVTGSTLSGNSATGGNQAQGGGIGNNSGTVRVSDSTLSGNSAYAGGGIAATGTLTVSDSTLSGNSAILYGGGIESGGNVALTNVTLTANRANTNGGSIGGGGLSVASGGPQPVLHNTLIAGNFRGATGTARDDVYGILNPSGDYNLIGDGTGMTGLNDGVNGNLVGSADNPIDPLLGPLVDNGGPTLTHALLSGSPAIDAGNNDYATDWDQRGPGFPRIVHGIIDIGAFEVQDGGSPGRASQPHPNPLRLAGSALLSPTLSPSRILSTGQIPENTLAIGTERDVTAVDQLFASPNQVDSRMILSQPIHHAGTEGDSWALDPFRSNESLFI
jgi:hypothetical protein